MKLRLIRVETRQIDAMYEIVPRQDDLLQKIKICSASRPLDLEILGKERPVVSKPAFLAHLVQFGDDLLVPNLIHVTAQKCVERRLQKVEACRAGDVHGSVGLLPLFKEGRLVGMLRVARVHIRRLRPLSCI